VVARVLVLDEVEEAAGAAAAAAVSAPTSIATYDELVTEFLPPWISRASQLVMIMLLTLVAVLFVDVAHDSLSSTYPMLGCRDGYPLRAGICAVAFLCSLPDKLESLKFTSLVGFFSLFFLLVVVGDRCVEHVFVVVPGDTAPPENWDFSLSAPDRLAIVEGHAAASREVTFSGLVFAVTTQLGAFAAAFNVIAAQAELPLELQRAGAGTTVAIVPAVAAGIFYALFGMAGYLALDGHPPRDILTGFPPSDALVSTARVAIGVVCVLKAPLFANPLKSMLTARFPVAMLPREGSLAKSAVLAFVIYATVFGISTAVSDPSVCFGYVSAIGVNVIMFILPGLCLARAALQGSDVSERQGLRHAYALSFFGWTMALFGLAALGLGVDSTINYHPSINSTEAANGTDTWR
jgi:hypothetical protein